MMTDLFDAALAEGIEVDYVRRFIRARKLAPPPGASEHWPWPIRILTLGGFELRCEGEPQPLSGKSHHRLLELLGIIVALGAPGVSLGTVAALLWPASEGDAAADALRVALHRLRSFLGVRDAVTVADGKVSLNPRCCWIDARALEQLLECDGDGDGDAADAALPAALRLYRGPFLAGEEERGWQLPCRERLHSKCVRAIERGGARRLRRGDLDGAIELYRKGVEVDPLAEGFYRGLMECHLQQGSRAEALQAYRRCRQLLSVVLGVAPSASTEALHRRALGDGA